MRDNLAPDNATVLAFPKKFTAVTAFNSDTGYAAFVVPTKSIPKRFKFFGTNKISIEDVISYDDKNYNKVQEIETAEIPNTVFSGIVANYTPKSKLDRSANRMNKKFEKAKSQITGTPNHPDEAKRILADNGFEAKSGIGEYLNPLNILGRGNGYGNKLFRAVLLAAAMTTVVKSGPAVLDKTGEIFNVGVSYVSEYFADDIDTGVMNALATPSTSVPSFNNQR